MKKSTIVLTIVALCVAFASTMMSASASHCGTGTNDAHDRFGSCEKASDGTIKCGSGTDAAGVATVIVANDANTTGVQGCADEADSFPIAGRVGAYRNNGDGSVTVFIDGGETSKNPGGAKGWQRYDVRPNDSGKTVCARRGTGGTYYNNTNSGKGSSTPDSAGVVNHSVGSNGSTGACQ